MKLQLIHIKDYLLAVDDSNYYDEYYLNKVDMQIYKRVSGSPYPVVGGVWHKKITHHLPLNNAPVLEGIELLPPLEDEAERLAKELIKCSDNIEIEIVRTIWINGYNKSQKTHPYSDDDMIDFATFRNGGDVREEFKLWKEQRTKTLYYL